MTANDATKELSEGTFELPAGAFLLPAIASATYSQLEV
jgi:hypothetical protein